MKHKILITGKNNSIIDDFFDHMDDEFIMLTTSLRFKDMTEHMKYFEPDLFVYCLNNETAEDCKRLISFKRILSKHNVDLVFIGDETDCEALQVQTNNMAELVLTKPLSAERIKRELVEYLKQLEAIREENRRLQEELAKKAEAGGRKHVLVIDDDPRQLNIIKEYLHEDYDIATAISGKIAYRFLEKKKTDLILLDYEMPEENGPMVLTNLREKGYIDNVPVIFLTGTTEREKIQQALALKPQGYLLKPVDREKLIGNIQKFFGE